MHMMAYCRVMRCFYYGLLQTIHSVYFRGGLWKRGGRDCGNTWRQGAGCVRLACRRRGFLPDTGLKGARCEGRGRHAGRAGGVVAGKGDRSSCGVVRFCHDGAVFGGGCAVRLSETGV